MRGRKPTPTAIKIARGNPGQRALNLDEPHPSTEFDLAVPEILTGDPDAAKEWARTAPMLHRVGVLTEVDLDALTMYCATFSRWKQAERHVQRVGMVIPRPDGSLALNPHLGIAMKAQNQCRAMLVEFGLTPVSRSRVHAPKKNAPDAQRERFFGASLRTKPA